MGVTIATHNGSRVAREHNIRNRRVTDREQHIDPNGVHEIWIDEKVRDAYDRIFGDALEAYNNKQTRQDRQIRSYYNAVCNDARKHPVYEMIIGVYGRGEDGISICSEKMGYEIMREYVDGWRERNPNLEIIGAYYHADEEGEPHCHIDYIPVAHGYKRGLETQNGLVKALGEMGYEKNGRLTAQIQWEASENKHLEQLCNKRGLVVEHIRDQERKHLETEQYKATQALYSAIDNTNELLHIQDGINAEIEQLEAKRDTVNRQAVRALNRKARIINLKRDRHRGGYTYDKNLVQDIQEEVKSLKQEAEIVSYTNLDIQRAYDRLQEQYEEFQEQQVNFQQLADKKTEELDTRRRQLNTMQLNIDSHIADQAKRHRNDRLERLENYCEHIQLQDGRSVLEHFKEQERNYHREHNHQR